jgi:glycosyltransferase involved in cell wall biosynthesis
MPKLTCITTTFNDGPALMTSVRAVLAQGFGDFEFLIVDDGSRDDTASVLAGLDDPRIRVIRQANDGLSGARNKALEQVRGDYVCFLDADDCRPGWAFAAIAETIDHDAPDVILCRGVLSELRGELLPFYDAARFDRIAELCPEGSITPAHAQAARIRPLAQLIEPQSANKVVRTAFLRASGIGFPNTHFFEDIFFHTNILATARRVSFVHTPCFTYFRRYGRPQITATAGDTRFDIIAVTRMTLQTFALRPEFHDPLYRGAVLASCLRIVEWCGNTITHHHRFHFHQLVRAMLRMIDPLWLHVPEPVRAELGEAGAVLARHVEEPRRAG